jgi:hypothetical protein
VAIPFPSGFVLDRATKLVWHRCPLGTSLESDAAGPLCRGDAEWLDMRFTLARAKHFSSYGDAWRLPTVDELKTLSVAPNRCCHALDPIAFPVFDEPAERLIARDEMARYAFHTATLDEARRLSWRVDSATGLPLEEPLRQEGFIRLVRNATPEELTMLAQARPLDRVQLSSVSARLKPQTRERSAPFIEGREAALRGGQIIDGECNTGSGDDRARGCREGIRANLNARYRQGIEWAKANQPAKSYHCKFDDPIATVGCRQYFRKYLGDVFPNLPEATTTAECEVEATAELQAGTDYGIATGALAPRDMRRHLLSNKGSLQDCSVYDRTHEQGLKVLNRPGYEGGPSPY